VADIRPSDHELYLARVAAALRMPDTTTQEITEELAAHLADASHALVEAGLTTNQADREALARLGNPEDLANGVRRAHQTRRRLATAIGPAWVSRNCVTTGRAGLMSSISRFQWKCSRSFMTVTIVARPMAPPRTRVRL
jgi:uncharacterized membrane protein